MRIPDPTASALFKPQDCQSPRVARTTTVTEVIIAWIVESGGPTDLRTELLRSVSVVIAAFV
jgi:hypothetical protein